MKTNKRLFVVTLVLIVTYVLSACGGLPQPAGQSPDDQAAIKVRAVEVAYTGVIEVINSNEWTINGQTIVVDPLVVRDGPFQVGDTVKVEGEINPDGTFRVSRVEAPSAADLAELPQLGDDNANENSNDANSNDANANDTNSNDDNSNDDDASNSNGNSNDDDDDGNTNGNSNDDDDDDSNSNGNNNDDDNDDVSNSNDNSNDDNDNGSSGGSNDNDDSGDNDNGDGDSIGDDDNDNGD